MPDPVNLEETFARFSDHWSPKIIGRINDMELKAVKVQGEFVWHSHPETDEFFLVHTGRLTIQLADQDDVHLGPGEFYVVAQGTEHRPVAEDECQILLLEPVGIVNTGDPAAGDLTASEECI